MANKRTLRSLRSWLFTPATKPDRFGKAAEAGADALIIDLEDSVALLAKEQARRAALENLERKPQKILCALRSNTLRSRAGLDDLQSLLSSSAQPDYLILPKCESAGEIEMVAALLREAGKSTEIVVSIETAKGIDALTEITRVQAPAALLFGAGDMAADLGAEVSWEPLLWSRSRVVQAAAAAGIVAIDSPYFDIANSDGLRRETKASGSLGFSAKCAIHPAHIAIINEVMTPQAEEIAKAREILAASRNGAASVRGQMVDEAVARTARVVLERAGLKIDE